LGDAPYGCEIHISQWRTPRQSICGGADRFHQGRQRAQGVETEKAFYSLHQAPRAWNTKLDVTLTSLELKKSSSEPALYTRKNKGFQLIVGVYVDDLVITGANSAYIVVFKKEMTKAFKMSDLGLLRYYLGIEVIQSTDGITLSQGAYVVMILEKAGMTCCNFRQTTMECRLKLSKCSSKPLVDPTEFHSVVGSLRYLVNTRPDIAFAVGYVSRFLGELHADHMVAVKHILRWDHKLEFTIEEGLRQDNADGLQ
jgi:hypothetical protein